MQRKSSGIGRSDSNIARSSHPHIDLIRRHRAEFPQLRRHRLQGRLAGAPAPRLIVYLRPPAVLKPVQEGRIHTLAVMTRQRNPARPAVPAIAEAGLPEVQFDSWSGIVAPKGTPRRVVEQLHGATRHALRKAALRELFLQYGVEPTPENTPETFMRLLQDEYLRFQALIRDGGIKPE